MTAPATPSAIALDFAEADRWPTRAAAHVLGIGLLCAVLVALPVSPTDLDRHQLPKETIVHLATWLAFVLARPVPPQGLRPAARWALVILVGVATLSAVHAGNGWLAFRGLALMFTGAAALVTARHVAALGHARTLLVWCTIAGIAGAATALAQAYGVSSVLFATARAPGGTFGNRNFMAHASALTLPIVVLGALTGRLRTAVLCSAGSAILVAAIVLSRSRAAWLGALAGVAVLAVAVVAARRRGAVPVSKGRVTMLSVVTALSIAGALIIPNRLAWRSRTPYSDTLTALANRDEGSGRGRVLQYRNTARLIAQHPLLGVGPGNWPLRYRDVAPLNDPSWVWGDVIPLNPWPSSDWFALVSECGLLAGVATLLLALAIAWRAILAVRASGGRALAGAALLAMVTTLAVVGTFDAVLLLPTALLLVAIGTGALLQWCDVDGAPITVAGHPAVRTAAMIAVLLGLCALRSSLQTAAYVVAGNGRSLRRLTWASRIDPGSYPIRIALAQRLECREARVHIVAALHLAPEWPASVLAARRCGLPVPR